MAGLRRVGDATITKLVAKEVVHGLKFVTDEEYRRRWWHPDWLKRSEGLTTQHLEKEHNDVVNHIELDYISGGTSYNAERTHVEIKVFDFLTQEAKKYLDVTARRCISSPDMTLVDNYLQVGVKEVPHYGGNIDAPIKDIALAYQCAIQDLHVHGCRYLQVSDTSWIYMIGENFLEKVSSLGYEKAEVLEWFRRVSTKALEGKPTNMIIASHFYKGNFKGHPLFNGSYGSVVPTISQIPYDGFFVEYNDECSGSFAPWPTSKGTGVTLVAGLISTKNPVLESYDDIKRRYLEAKAVMGGSITLSLQCGFTSIEEGNCIDEETQWKRISLLISRKGSL